MFDSHLVKLFTLSIAALLIGCSGNSSTSFETRVEEKVTGLAGAANLAFATIQASPIGNQGRPSSDSANEGFEGRITNSVASGFFQVVIEEDSLGFPGVVIATSPEGKARMRCEKPDGCDGVEYLGFIPVEQGFEYRSAVVDVRADMSINVNWLTHVANAFAFTSYVDQTDDGQNNPATPKAGVYTRYTIDVANKRMSQIFGISDIISVRPIPPSQIADTTDLPLLLQRQGIKYGALLAGIQQLKPDNVTVNDYLNTVIQQFNLQQGQLLLKTPQGSDDVSIDDVWAAAHQILSDNIEHLRARNVLVPGVADSVVAEIQQTRAGLEGREGQYTSYAIPQLSDEAQRELDSVSDAKLFIDDLNKQILNFDGSDPNTCSDSESDAADCMPSFVSLEYRRHIERYSQDLLHGLKEAGPDMMLAFHTVREALDYYATALAGQVDMTNPLAVAGRVRLENKTLDENSGIVDNSDIRKLVLTSFEQDKEPVVLHLSFVGDNNTPRTPTDGKFYLFRINLEGTLKENGRQFEFNVGTEDTGAQVKPYLEIEYENEYSAPVSFNVEEPLTIRLVWPAIRSISTGLERTYDNFQSIEIELAGISDPVLESSEMRYNLKRVSYRLLNEGPFIGSVDEDNPANNKRDESEGVLTLNSSAWQYYYPENKWPDIDDYLTFRSGFDVTQQEDNVFRYFVGTESVNGANISFIDLVTLNSTADVVSGTRYRQYPYQDDDKLFDLESCELDLSNPDSPVVISCGERVKRLARDAVTIEELVQKLLLNIYTIDGRGDYRPKFVLDINNHVASLPAGQWQTIPGRVVPIATNLFEYTTGSENLEVSGSDVTALYIDVVVLTDQQKPILSERNRLIPISGESDKFYLQRCLIDVDDSGQHSVAKTDKGIDVCDNRTETVGKADISSLALAIQRAGIQIPSRGFYQLKLPLTAEVVKDEETGEYQENIIPLPLLESQAVNIDGVLFAPYSLGVESLSLRLAAELFNRDDDKEKEALGPLIADVQMRVLAENVFDVAVTFGYDYQYLVNIVPSGNQARGLYLAYRTGLGADNESIPDEIGTLLIFRGGVVLAGKEAAENIGLFTTSEARYNLTETDTGVNGCAVANRNFNVGSCDALAFIGYKGAILGVVREERNGVYIARFINGDFVVLGR